MRTEWVCGSQPRFLLSRPASFSQMTSFGRKRLVYHAMKVSPVLPVHSSMHRPYYCRCVFSVDTDLHTKPATNKSTSGTSLSSPVRMFNARPVCNSQMSSTIRGTSRKFSCNQVCLAPSHSQLNMCLKTQPLEWPRCSKTLITESVALHADPTRHSDPLRSRSPQRCLVVRQSL